MSEFRFTCTLKRFRKVWQFDRSTWLRLLTWRDVWNAWVVYAVYVKLLLFETFNFCESSVCVGNFVCDMTRYQSLSSLAWIFKHTSWLGSLYRVNLFKPNYGTTDAFTCTIKPQNLHASKHAYPHWLHCKSLWRRKPIQIWPGFAIPWVLANCIFLKPFFVDKIRTI